MSKVKIEIKSWFSGDVLFEYESDNATMKKAVEAAVDGSADLRDADLSGANLRDADLRDANLRDANLSGADLRDADLRDANLRDADLRDANLRDANLSGADLRDANLSGADLRDADLRDANLRDADLRDANLSGADLRDANLSGAAIYYSDGNFDVNYRRGYFLSLTNLEEIETEMHHDVKSCRRWSFTWKNVLRIKSWKLKPAAGSFEAVAKNASAASKAIADGAKSQGTDEKCAQSETPEIEVGDRVAFKHGDEPAEALCGDVIATKGSEAVVEVSQLLGRRAFILPFDKLIVIPPKAQEQSNG